MQMQITPLGRLSPFEVPTTKEKITDGSVCLFSPATQEALRALRAAPPPC